MRSIAGILAAVLCVSAAASQSPAERRAAITGYFQEHREKISEIYDGSLLLYSYRAKEGTGGYISDLLDMVFVTVNADEYAAGANADLNSYAKSTTRITGSVKDVSGAPHGDAQITVYKSDKSETVLLEMKNDLGSRAYIGSLQQGQKADVICETGAGLMYSVGASNCIPTADFIDKLIDRLKREVTSKPLDVLVSSQTARNGGAADPLIAMARLFAASVYAAGNFEECRIGASANCIFRTVQSADNGEQLDRWIQTFLGL